jgi:hypothetical protein
MECAERLLQSNPRARTQYCPLAEVPSCHPHLPSNLFSAGDRTYPTDVEPGEKTYLIHAPFPLEPILIFLKIYIFTTPPNSPPLTPSEIPFFADIDRERGKYILLDKHARKYKHTCPAKSTCILCRHCRLTL